MNKLIIKTIKWPVLGFIVATSFYITIYLCTCFAALEFIRFDFEFYRFAVLFFIIICSIIGILDEVLN